MLDGIEHVALVKGDVTSPEPVLVRVHAVNMLEDLLGEGESGRGDQLHQAMRMIGEAGRGVVVILREPSPHSISDRVKDSARPSRIRRLPIFASTASARRFWAISGSRT